MIKVLEILVYFIFLKLVSIFTGASCPNLCRSPARKKSKNRMKFKQLLASLARLLLTLDAVNGKSQRILFGVLLCFLAKPSGSLAVPSPEARWKHGYTDDVRAERQQVARDLVWVMRPFDGAILHDRIFNQKLSKEFRERYEQRFGQTEIERVALAPNRLSYYNDVYGMKGTPQELLDERRKFGEFMVRRLAEWHVENYAKSDPKVRPVWEAKEKISNLKVEVASFRFDAQYSIAGNTLDIKMVNPWVESKVTLIMNPDQFGPGPIDETLLSVVKPISQRYTVEGRWRVTDGIVSLIQTRPIGRFWSSSLTTSAAVKDGGSSPRETIWLAGISRDF